MTTLTFHFLAEDGHVVNSLAIDEDEMEVGIARFIHTFADETLDMDVETFAELSDHRFVVAVTEPRHHRPIDKTVDWDNLPKI